MESYEHDYRTCKEIECDLCQELIDYGIVCACDECDMPGDQEAYGWHLMEDGRVLCTDCFEKKEDKN